MSYPTSVVTERRLEAFYQEILPYLGGSADAGFTPIGTIIAVYSETAPANYLACDGSIYNKSDYPELAAHLLALTDHSAYEVSGDSTKFKVPDLRGEFLRGTGTNSHSGCGNGANVGVHQTPTKHMRLRQYVGTGTAGNIGTYGISNASTWNADSDTNVGSTGNLFYANTTKDANNSGTVHYTSRPTNTSVLFCIATKNIYLNPSLDYSTDEKVVGTWIDGKTLYQKTVDCGDVPNAQQKTITAGLSNVDKVVSLDGILCNQTTKRYMPLPPVYLSSPTTNQIQLEYSATEDKIKIQSGATWTNWTSYVTIQYTKSTT